MERKWEHINMELFIFHLNAEIFFLDMMKFLLYKLIQEKLKLISLQKVKHFLRDVTYLVV